MELSDELYDRIEELSETELIKDILNERNQTTVDSKRRNLP